MKQDENITRIDSCILKNKKTSPSTISKPNSF